MTTTPLPPLPRITEDPFRFYTADQVQAYAAQARADLEAENKRLREALERIAGLDGTEENEWDCVERVMPLMADIARTALKDTK